MIDAYRQEVAEREGEEHRAAKRQREQAGEAAPESCAGARGEAEIVCRPDAAPAARSAITWRPARTSTFEIRARAGGRSTTSCSASRSRPRADVEVWGTNTDIEGYVPGHFEGEATVRLTCPALRLAPGEYVVDVAIHAKDGGALRLPAPAPSPSR